MVLAPWDAVVGGTLVVGSTVAAALEEVGQDIVADQGQGEAALAPSEIKRHNFFLIK